MKSNLAYLVPRNLQGLPVRLHVLEIPQFQAVVYHVSYQKPSGNPLTVVKLANGLQGLQVFLTPANFVAFALFSCDETL